MLQLVSSPFHYSVTEKKFLRTIFILNKNGTERKIIKYWYTKISWKMSDIQCRKFIGWSWEWNGGVHDDKSPTRLPTEIYDQMYREFFNQGTLEVTCFVRKSKLFIIASLFPSRGPKYCPIKAVWSKGLWLSCRFKYYRKFAQKGGRELFKVSPKLWTKASLRVLSTRS